jgi:hypothetical protein
MLITLIKPSLIVEMYVIIFQQASLYIQALHYLDKYEIVYTSYRFQIIILWHQQNSLSSNNIFVRK